jgi:hypothetical protein
VGDVFAKANKCSTKNKNVTARVLLERRKNCAIEFNARNLSLFCIAFLYRPPFVIQACLNLGGQK